MAALFPLLTSKKFQASVIGVVVAVVGHLGLELDPDALMVVVAPLISFIAGQAVADFGKEKAKVENGKK